MLTRLQQNIGQSTTIVVAGLFFIVLSIRRDALMISFFIGAIVNAILSKVLKRIIGQTRPLELFQSSSSNENTSNSNTNNSHIPSDNGMPSSHAMSLGFIMTCTACYIQQHNIQLPLGLYTIISLYYRVQAKLHTWQQVVVGTIVGSTNGYIWYRLCRSNNNPFHINILEIVQRYLFPNTNQFPISYLLIPLLIGATTIGSFERRIGALLQRKRKKLQ